MNRMLMTAVATLALLVSSTMLWGQDERLHGANAVTGEVVAAHADGMDLKTRTDTVKLKFSSKTKFEHDKKTVDKSDVKVGDRAGVVGNKLPLAYPVVSADHDRYCRMCRALASHPYMWCLAETTG